MRIARILYNNEEKYVQLKSNELYQIDTIRIDGIESYFDRKIVTSDKITDINDENITWLPPVFKPGKIICVGRNYLEHSKEQGMSKEQKPLLFSKYSTSMMGHMSQIEYPQHTHNLDYEVELAVIIGKKARKIEDDPFNYIFGYTVANDITARDVQKSEKQWTRGKAFDQSLPIGPYIVTRDEVDPSTQEIWLTVNGEKRQSSHTSLMIFDIPFLIKYISNNITLEPGDIILTGTPAGVGYYMDPKATLQKGDIVQSGITSIGELRFSIK